MDDEDFQALSDRQRRALDKAFDRGLRYAGGRPSKRRRLESGRSTPASGGGFVGDGGGGFVDDGGGGFVDDGGGGFIDDGGGGFIDDGGGGFIDDGGGGFVDDGGGFMDEDGGGFVDTAGPSTTSTPAPAPAPATTEAEPEHIPLRLIPQLLGALSLPSDDDVLAVFQASASGWGEGGGDGITRKDFRAVCAALMGPDDGAEAASSAGEESEPFEPSDESFSEPEDEEYNAPAKGKGKEAAKSSRKSKLEVSAAPKLTPRQKEAAREIWDMLKPNKTGQGAHMLGRDEVKRWARELGEMWTDTEVRAEVCAF